MSLSSAAAAAVVYAAAAATAAAAAATAAAAAPKKRKQSESKTDAVKKSKTMDISTVAQAQLDAKTRAIDDSLPPKPATLDATFLDESEQRIHMDVMYYTSLLTESTPQSIRTALDMINRIGNRWSSGIRYFGAATAAWLEIKQVDGLSEDGLCSLLSVMGLSRDALTTLAYQAISAKKSADHLRAILRLVPLKWAGMNNLVVGLLFSNGTVYTTPKENPAAKEGDPCQCIFCGVLDRIGNKPTHVNAALNIHVECVDEAGVSTVFTPFQYAVRANNSHAVWRLLQYIPILELDSFVRVQNATDPRGWIWRSTAEPIAGFFTAATSQYIKDAIDVQQHALQVFRYEQAKALRECLYDLHNDMAIFKLIDAYNADPVARAPSAVPSIVVVE